MLLPEIHEPPRAHSVAKSAKGSQKGSAGKPTDKSHGPRQQAQQLKKQRFNKVVNDLAANKGFFMSFVRHPSNLTWGGISFFLMALKDVKTSSEYARMVEVSTKRSKEVADLKRTRDRARLAVKRGRWEHEQDANTPFADLYGSGVLQKKQEEAEAAYGSRKMGGVAMCLGGPPWVLS